MSMTQRIIILAFTVSCLAGVSMADSLPLLNQEESIKAADKLLVSFVHLGCFVDRGVAVSPFFDFEEHLKDELSADFLSLPKDVREFLLQERQPPAIEEVEFLWPPSKNTSLSEVEALGRFSRLGMIDLLCMKDSKVLKSRIESRADIRDTLKNIFTEATLEHRSFFNKNVTRRDKLVTIGSLRRHSVDLDMAILSVLTEQERLRLSQIVVHVMPIAEKLANKDHLVYELGSANLNLKPARRR